MGNEKRCGVLLRYKSDILSVDERVMALKICELRTCGDGVSLTFLAVMRCSLNFFAMCTPPPPCPPLNTVE